MVPWLLVLVLSRLVPRSQLEFSAGWRRGEWVQVYNPCRVKTIRIAAYGCRNGPRQVTWQMLYFVDATHRKP